MTTLVTGVVPLPASSNTIIPVEAAAVNEEKIADEIVERLTPEKP